MMTNMFRCAMQESLERGPATVDADVHRRDGLKSWEETGRREASRRKVRMSRDRPKNGRQHPDGANNEKHGE